MPLKIGLTGGMGSGKTIVAKIFAELGVPVYYADEAAKKLLNEHEWLKESVIRHFGKETYTDGNLNRRFLASKVFNDPKKLELLNALVHPATIRDAEEWMNQQTTPYILKEAALIFESGSQKGLDYIIGVSSPVSLRVSRSMKRDNISREEVVLRMNRQIEESIKMRLCDFIIYNDEQQLVVPQVLRLHEKFLALSVSSVQ